ncbi:hypothetical protein P8452_46069 [Trifolium repens]|nr:homeobox-leucine zipper protein ATHB-40 [Trifolium repens]WJX60915.1 hypothetical protein P8452_46069 [Trifolium repens]
MNHQDQMMLMSQLFPSSAYTEVIPQQGEKKKRRRRTKKIKGDSVNEMNKKRKLTDEQVNLLEQNFTNEHKLESERKDKLAMELGLDPRQVAVWFQNRRARWKNRKLEEEYNNLKKFHESTILEKCLLETEVLKLREQLSEADKEIKRLREPIENVTSNSSSTSSMSQSMEVVDPPFLGEFGVDYGYDDDVFFVPNETHYFNGMEWVTLYI